MIQKIALLFVLKLLVMLQLSSQDCDNWAVSISGEGVDVSMYDIVEDSKKNNYAFGRVIFKDSLGRVDLDPTDNEHWVSADTILVGANSPCSEFRNGIIFLIKLDSCGNFIWAKYATSGLGIPVDFEISESDELYLLFSHYKNMDLSLNGNFNSEDLCIGNQHYSLSKFDTSGELLWSRTYNHKTLSSGYKDKILKIHENTATLLMRYAFTINDIYHIIENEQDTIYSISKSSNILLRYNQEGTIIQNAIITNPGGLESLNLTFDINPDGNLFFASSYGFFAPADIHYVLNQDTLYTITLNDLCYFSISKEGELLDTTCSLDSCGILFTQTGPLIATSDYRIHSHHLLSGLKKFQSCQEDWTVGECPLVFSQINLDSNLCYISDEIPFAGLIDVYTSDGKSSFYGNIYFRWDYDDLLKYHSGTPDVIRYHGHMDDEVEFASLFSRTGSSISYVGNDGNAFQDDNRIMLGFAQYSIEHQETRQVGIIGKQKMCNSNYSEIQVTACQSYESPSGQMFTETGIYEDILPNQEGCDSIITIDLTIEDEEYFERFNAHFCESYTSPSGNIYYESAQILDTVPVEGGCDSIFDINMVLVEYSVEVAQDEIILTAIQDSVEYQWIDCDNDFSLIDGEISAEFIAEMDGNYAVIIDPNGCSDTSECYNVMLTGTDNIERLPVRVFPNPSDGRFHLDLSYVQEATYIRIYDAKGVLIEAETTGHAELILFELNVPNGIYFVEVLTQDESKRSVEKILIQKDGQ